MTILEELEARAQKAARYDDGVLVSINLGTLRKTITLLQKVAGNPGALTPTELREAVAREIADYADPEFAGESALLDEDYALADRILTLIARQQQEEVEGLKEVLRDTAGVLLAAGDAICADPEHDVGLMLNIEAARRTCLQPKLGGE